MEFKLGLNENMRIKEWFWNKSIKNSHPKCITFNEFKNTSLFITKITEKAVQAKIEFKPENGDDSFEDEVWIPKSCIQTFKAYLEENPKEVESFRKLYKQYNAEESFLKIINGGY